MKAGLWNHFITTLAFVNHIGTISKVILLLLMLHTSITKVNRLQLLSTTKFKNRKSRQYEKKIKKKKTTILQDILCVTQTKVTFPIVIYKSFNRLQTQISKRREIVIICHTTYRYIFIFIFIVYVTLLF